MNGENHIQDFERKSKTLQLFYFLIQFFSNSKEVFKVFEFFIFSCYNNKNLSLS